MDELYPGDPNYPALLGAIPSPPTLYVRGAVTVDDALALAIVGARDATPYGVEVAEPLPGAQSHARRAQPRRRRGRSGRAERRPDHGGFRRRPRARSIRRSRQNYFRDERRNEPAPPGRC